MEQVTNIIKRVLKWIGIIFGALITLTIVLGIFTDDKSKESVKTESYTQTLDDVNISTKESKVVMSLDKTNEVKQTDNRETKAISNNAVPQYQSNNVNNVDIYDEDGNLDLSLDSSSTKEAVIYHGNYETGIYHVTGCRYYNCSKCTVKFRSRDEAEKNGYHLCGKE